MKILSAAWICLVRHECFQNLGEAHSALLENPLARWLRQSVGQLKADDSGPLHAEQGGVCERETRLTKGLMETLGGRTNGGPGLRSLVFQ